MEVHTVVGPATNKYPLLPFKAECVPVSDGTKFVCPYVIPVVVHDKPRLPVSAKAPLESRFEI